LSNTQIQLKNTQEELKETKRNLQEELRETKRKLEEKVNTLQNVEMRFPGVRTWKITGFGGVMKRAKSGEKIIIRSNPFFDHGYKFRLSCYANGLGDGQDTHLSIFFHILKGEYDAILSWPFCKKVIFTLVDQQDDPNDRKNITYSLTPNDHEGLKECIMRPSKGELLGFGFSEFVSHDKLKERRYIVDDTMFIQVEVAPP